MIKQVKMETPYPSHILLPSIGLLAAGRSRIFLAKGLWSLLVK